MPSSMSCFGKVVLVSLIGCLRPYRSAGNLTVLVDCNVESRFSAIEVVYGIIAAPSGTLRPDRSARGTRRYLMNFGK